MKNISIITFLFFAFALQLKAQNVEVPLRFDNYHDNQQTIDAIIALEKAYPKLANRILVGKSDEGRAIWALEINNPNTGTALSKPGVYVDGNIHGNEIQATEVCLYLADYLLKNYNSIPRIKKIVDENAWYIIPISNVDGRFHFFQDPNTMNSNRGLRIARDDDHDGLFNEDFPDDLDNDGNIVEMRKADPNGMYRTSHEDPRIMVRVKPGEQGEWTKLGNEGIDNDGDGRINEDAEGYLDPNRNWGFNWQPDYVQRGAGSYPTQGKSIRDISHYLIARPNIIVAFAFHNYGGMFLRGPSTGDQGELPQQDIKVYDYLGVNAERIVPGYKYLISWKDLYGTYGDFTDFTDNLIGSYGFVGELTLSESVTYKGVTDEKNKTEFSGAYERIKFNDHVAHGTLFKEWTKYNHPTYGEIEIGGWVKMSTRIPHPFMLEDLVHRNASAVIFTAENTPKVSLELISKKKIGNDLYKVRLRLSNSKAIPTMPYSAYKNKLYPADMLKVSGVKVISGGEIQNIYFNKVNYKEFKPEVQFFYIPGFETKEFEFLVSGGNAKFEYSSRKAKNQSLNVSVK
ncbi:MAG: hypothetical protein KAI79_17185 [Bacteroidales bacterium]|nr:hypothetical protein [Bacteroidales bacterium]